MTHRDFCARAFSLFLLSMVGCGGSSLSSVSGTVTYDGEPVADGEIRYVSTAKSKDAPTMSGARIVDGAYSIPADKGISVGSCRVEIVARRKTGKQLEAVPPAPVGTMIEETIQYIPREYNTASTLTEEIKPGSNEKNFELKKIE